LRKGINTDFSPLGTNPEKVHYDPAYFDAAKAAGFESVRFFINYTKDLGGKTVRGISLYGIGPELRDWFGQWPMHRSWRDVFGDGAEVYSEFTVPQTLAPAAMTYATIYALEKQAGTIPPGSKPNPLEH